jgi:AraC-like DNA-binding protein
MVQDLTGLPPRQAATAFNESIGQVMNSILLGPRDAPVLYRDTAYVLRDFILNRMDIPATHTYRSKAVVARANANAYVLQFSVHGQADAVDSSAKVRPGDLICLDLAQPSRLITSDARVFGLSVARHVLAPLLKTPDEINQRVFSGENPLVALLHGHLRTLYAQMPSMTLTQAQSIATPTIELLAAALNGAVTEAVKGSIDLAQVERIRRYIDAHLLDPELDTSAIAAAFAISPRKLYYLFEPHGGVIAYLHQQRLRRARDAIIDPANSRRGIQDIAQAHGFAHRQTFSAAFMRTFGMSPRAARDYVRQQGRAPAEPVHLLHDRWEWYRGA